MRIAVFSLALAGCSTELPMCQLADERRIDADALGPDGFTGEQLHAAAVGERSFDAGTSVDYPDFPTGVDGVVTVTIGERRGRPWVREWECAPTRLYVPVDVRVTSADGSLDVEGLAELSGPSLAEADVSWSVASEAPLAGLLPDAVVEAAAVEQGEHCPADTDEEATVRVFLGGTREASELYFDAQYRRRGVCNYAAVLAAASLTPR